MSDIARQPVVRLTDGVVRGTTVAGVSAFLGIPYAAAPFGANRMRAPQPVAPWDGEREATAFGPTVPKGDYPPPYVPLFPEVVIPGEECLNLNVWTPDLGAAGLPVLVWIHGGSFMNGSSSVGEYDGAAFARDGVVCVSINYRLAAEGFLFLDDGIVNLGLLDQLAALGWVQRNIGAFGGDPARVTVAGESAGAMSVTTLLSMPLAAGLFAQAIAFPSLSTSCVLAPRKESWSRFCAGSGTAMASAATVIRFPCALSRNPIVRFSGGVKSARNTFRHTATGPGFTSPTYRIVSGNCSSNARLDVCAQLLRQQPVEDVHALPDRARREPQRRRTRYQRCQQCERQHRCNHRPARYTPRPHGRNLAIGRQAPQTDQNPHQHAERHRLRQHRRQRQREQPQHCLRVSRHAHQQLEKPVQALQEDDECRKHRPEHRARYNLAKHVPAENAHP